MAEHTRFYIELSMEAYCFYSDIARHLNRPAEDVLSNLICKYAEQIAAYGLDGMGSEVPRKNQAGGRTIPRC